MTSGMTLLTERDKAQFLARFYGCDDGVVRSFAVTYPYGWFTRPNPGEEEVAQANILLSVMDREQDTGWSNLSLVLNDVREFRVWESGGRYNTVLPDSLKLAWFDGLVFVDFSLGDYDLSTVEGFRKARRYMVARELYWRVEPYDR